MKQGTQALDNTAQFDRLPRTSSRKVSRKKQAVFNFLSDNRDRYLSVDEIYERLIQTEAQDLPSRTTIYRAVEAMVKDKTVAKVVVPGGGEESRYRIIDENEGGRGQLVCVCCGRVIPFDCDSLVNFAEHIQLEHRFSVDLLQSLIYGRCALCAHHSSQDVHKRAR